MKFIKFLSQSQHQHHTLNANLYTMLKQCQQIAVHLTKCLKVLYSVDKQFKKDIYTLKSLNF